jgi:hypothetical protein
MRTLCRLAVAFVASAGLLLVGSLSAFAATAIEYGLIA